MGVGDSPGTSMRERVMLRILEHANSVFSPPSIPPALAHYRTIKTGSSRRAERIESKCAEQDLNLQSQRRLFYRQLGSPVPSRRMLFK